MFSYIWEKKLSNENSIANDTSYIIISDTLETLKDLNLSGLC